MSLQCWTFIDDVYECEKRGTTGDRVIVGLKDMESRCPAPSLNEYLELLSDTDDAREREIVTRSLVLAEKNPHFESSVRCFIQEVRHITNNYIFFSKSYSDSNSECQWVSSRLEGGLWVGGWDADLRIATVVFVKVSVTLIRMGELIKMDM